MSQRKFTINSRKFDGKIYRSWQAACLEEKEDYWLFVGEFSSEVNHKQLGVIRRGTVSYEYYWKKNWFNVFRFHEPEGDLRNFYCNINQPPTVTKNILDYIDLDVDILVWTDFNYQILDLDEFEINAKFFGYSKNLKAKVQESLDELIKMIETRCFPFDFVNVTG